ncbi:hypothetical protein SME38J_05030 [Serratia marcescens]|nr:hypothetical protein SME38J_05030 [Serratia marcescens]
MNDREIDIIKAIGESVAETLQEIREEFTQKLNDQAQAISEQLSEIKGNLLSTDTVEHQIKTAIQSLPVPQDAKDAYPAMIEKAIKDAVAALPPPQDGKSITVEDVRPLLETLVDTAVKRLPMPQDGKDADPAMIEKAIKDAVAALPPPQDGKSITVEDVRPLLETLVDTAVKRLPMPQDGKDADPAMIKKAIKDAVAALPPPQDGKSITVEDVRPLLETLVDAAVKRLPVPQDGKDADPAVIEKAVKEAVAAIPKPESGKPGRDALQLEIAPNIDEAKSYPRGTYATHNGGLWRAFEKTSGLRGWECLVDGVAAIDVTQTQERIFSVSVTRASGIAEEKTFTLPHMIYRGIFNSDRVYQPGDTVTWGGSLWLCEAETQDKPGSSNAKGWILAVKRGRDAG